MNIVGGEPISPPVIMAIVVLILLLSSPCQISNFIETTPIPCAWWNYVGFIIGIALIFLPIILTLGIFPEKPLSPGEQAKLDAKMAKYKLEWLRDDNDEAFTKYLLNHIFKDNQELADAHTLWKLTRDDQETVFKTEMAQSDLSNKAEETKP